MTQADPAAPPRFLDLSLGSVFKIAYFSVLGVYLFVVGLSAIPLTVRAAAGAYGPGGLVKTLLLLPFLVVAAPAVWAAFLSVGFLIRDLAWPGRGNTDLVFVGEGRDFLSLDSGSVLRLLSFSARGFVAVFALLFLAVALFGLGAALLAGDFGGAAKMGLLAIAGPVMVLVIVPYMWGFIFMLGSFLGRPVARLLGLGALRFRYTA